MMNIIEANNAWQKVIRIYKATREENRPNMTLVKITNELGRAKTREIFAIVAAIKKWDGRIWGPNRWYMDETPYDRDAADYTKIHGLDDIHTAHINNLITEMRKAGY